MPYLIVFGILVLLLVIIFSLIGFRIYRNYHYRNNLLKLFKSISAEREEIDVKIQHFKKGPYDFYLESDRHIYYIKVLKNYQNLEIIINNASKWQFSSFEFKDSDLRFIEGVDEMMRFESERHDKRVHRLFIIYPNAGTILKVINECEMVFVYPDTDVYGCNVITYRQLEEHHELLQI